MSNLLKVSLEVLNWLKSNVQPKARLQLDSRLVHPGNVFVACRGTAEDGSKYIVDACQRGASAILLETFPDSPSPTVPVGIPVMMVPNLRQYLGEIADLWYGKPSESLMVIAITGTNGKTSCANWIAQAFNELNIPCATMGTLGTLLPDGSSLGGSLTTPDVLTVHYLLDVLRDKGVKALAIEASSIGLDQGRLDAVRIDVAAFTNLTLDHLDYHQTMENYALAKSKLFKWPGLKAAVINWDDEVGEAWVEQWTSAVPLITYSMKKAVASVTISDYQQLESHQSLQLKLLERQYPIYTDLLGEHNISNMLLVAGVLQALAWSGEQISKALQAFKPVPGRLQKVVFESQEQPLVVVDYAHTPDALERALYALKPIAKSRGGQLVCVFGCGGDRDRTKRPLMGKIAEQQADKVWVTSDNPRTEKPHKILDEVVSMMKNPMIEEDRSLAILCAVLGASVKDIILIAGKGHETYQEIDGVRHAFDDREWAKLGLAMRLVRSVSIDSRVVQEGDIFVALKGEHFDAHEFLSQVVEKKALLAVVSEYQPDTAIEQVLVSDTLQAISVMAHAWRRQFELPVVAVTGSNGKTTTKEMIASIMHEAVGEQMLATQGNLNNHIGVPLTLLRLRSEHRLAVVELGMNHPGEIAQLAKITEPTVALVNNAQREHQEFMHTVQAVAQENGQVLTFLKKEGSAVFPAGDEFTTLWNELNIANHQCTFALQEKADVWASDISLNAEGSQFNLHFPNHQSVPIKLNIAGVHNVHNALAAASCCLMAGIDIKMIANGLACFKAVKGRMQTLSLPNGIHIIDDTYNANPDSVKAAIEVLSNMPSPRVLVLGDMAEVGSNSEQMHAEVGVYAKEKGIEYLFAKGKAVQAAIKAYGSSLDEALFEDVSELVKTILTLPIHSILVKGSRSSAMEKVVQALKQQTKYKEE